MGDRELKKARKIIESGKIKSVSDLKYVVKYWYSMGNSSSDIVNTVKDMDFCWQIKTISPSEIIEIIIQECSLEEYESIIENICIYNNEIDFLKQIEDDNVRKLMYCFLIYSKINNHSSGWIRYNKDAIFKMCGFSYDFGNKCVSACCKNGLELRVIGAKHSLVCYHLGFRKIDGDIYLKINKYDDVMKAYDGIEWGNNE